MVVFNHLCLSLTPIQNPPLLVEIENILPVSCAGGSNGAVFLNVLQGEPPFQFEWSNGFAEQDLKEIPAGLYSCTITDATGDQMSLNNIEVTEPALLTIAVNTIQHINCQFATGALSVSVEGGTPGYAYQWNTGQSSAASEHLPAGNYDITVTDDSGCWASLNTQIEEDFTAPFAGAGLPVNVPCSNTPTQLQGTGSTGPQFAYQWIGQNGGNILDGATELQPTVNHTGTYLLTVTDTINGCTATASTTVSSQYTAPAAVATGGVLDCIQNSVKLQASFSTQHTIFDWQGPNGYTSGLLQPVVAKAGNYHLTVTDTLTGCFTIATATVVQDTLHPAATASASGPISCINPTTNLMAWSSVPGASFQWSGPGNFNTSGAQPAATLPGLYTVVATNLANGCSTTATVTVSGSTTAPVVSASANGIITCKTSSVSLNGIIQPAGMTYSWTGPNGFTSTILTPIAIGPGVYTLKATNPQNGCTATASVTVASNTTPPDITASGGVKTCANPAVTLHANSGTAGVTYSWSGPAGYTSGLQNPVVNLTGSYTVTVYNPSNGCSNSASVNVTANTSQPTLLAYGTSISCLAPSSKVMASSTTQGATFAWTGPNGYTANIANPLVTVPGFYAVVVTNPVNGCTNSTSVVVDDNMEAPVANSGGNRNLNCLGIPILLSGSGSSTIGNFTYKWTTFDGHIVSGATSLYPRVDAIGTYTLKVTNNLNGCSALDSMEVFPAVPVNVNFGQLTQVACNGTSTGSATVLATGGTGIFAYAWSNGNTTPTASGLSAGVYSVTVSDTEGCSGTTSTQISQPPLLQANVSATAQTAFGVNNGTASVSVLGGVFPYTVKWSNNATTTFISGLAPGTYTVTATDNKGCTAVNSVQVNAVNCGLSGALAITNIACAGSSSGSITANLVNSNNPIVYAWSNNGQTKTISNLAAGNYTVTATDASGCSVILSGAVTSPAALVLTFVNKENVPCANAQTGALTAGVSGGKSPYTYAWSNGKTSAAITGLAAGNYTVTVTDANGCTKSLNAQITVTDQNPPQLILKNASVALDASGQATVTPAMFDNGSFDAECGIASWSVSPTNFDCSQIGARTVTLTATDLNGNSKSATATVTVTDDIAPTMVCPQAIYTGICAAGVQFALPQVADNCAVQPGQIQQTAGLPSGASFPSGKTLQAFSYTDAGGNTATCSFEIWVADEPGITIATHQASCSNQCDGTATLTPLDGTIPAVVQWSNGQFGNTATGLCPGSYTVTVTDVYGCSKAFPVAISNNNLAGFSLTAQSAPASCSATCDGSGALQTTGGTAPFGFAWSNGQNGATAGNLCPGQYTVTVTDANGCSVQQVVSVPVEDNVPPTLTCPANFSTSYCIASVHYNQPVVQDNCPINPQNLQLLSGLPSGAMFPQGNTIQVYRYTDAAGNSAQCSFTVQVAGPPDLSLTATDVTCTGACNGSASMVATGGFGPFSTLWSTNQGGPSVSGLCPGAYGVTVIDAAGCVETRQLAITEPQPLDLTVVAVNNDSGNSGTGSIQIEVSGGTKPYAFAWRQNGLLIAATQNLVNLPAGQYTVVVTDANGCTIASTALTLNNTVAAHEAAWAQGLQLQPNPATSSVRLMVAEPSGQAVEVMVVSSNGTPGLLQQFAALESVLSLDVSSLPTGLWLVRIKTADGREAVRKLVITH